MSLMKTKRVYHAHPYATSHTTPWERRGPKVIAIAESVAFPEGGGQQPDVGIVLQGDRTARFTDTQKAFTSTVIPKDFPAVKVGGEVHLELDTEIGPEWDDRLPVQIVIDRVRRAQLTRSHTAAHLVYVGLLEVMPAAKGGIRGCQIDVDGGRFDVQVDAPFTAEQIEIVSRTVADWTGRDHAVQIETLPDDPDCRIWVCNGVRIPCGGCHLPQTGLTGRLKIQRRSKGRTMDRLYYTMQDPLPDEFLNLHKCANVVSTIAD